MLGFTILDVVIGLAVVFFLISIVCSSLVEILASQFRWRAENLSAAVSSLFQDNSTLLKAFYEHPRIWTLSPDPGETNWFARAVSSLFNGVNGFLRTGAWDGLRKAGVTGNGRPSYIAAETFTDVMIDLVTAEKEFPPSLRGTFAGVRAILRNDVAASAGNPCSDVKLRQVLDEFGSTAMRAAPDTVPDVDALRLTAFRNALQQFYHETMERAGGWYKHHVQCYLLVLGLLIAAAVNIDTIAITQGLYGNPKLRQETEAVAQQLTQQKDLNQTGDSQKRMDDARKTLQSFAADGMPLGWNAARFDGSWGVVSKVVGILMTGVAVSMGAPFWFDLLNKLVSLRSSGEKPKPPTNDADGGGADQSSASSTVVTSGGATPLVGQTAVSVTVKPPVLPEGYWKLAARADDLKGFKWSVADYEPKKAAALARASLLAYSNEGAVRSVAKTWGFDDDKVVFVESDDTQAFVAWDDEVILVAFRGTEPTHLLDILSDAEFSLVKAQVALTGGSPIPLVTGDGKAHFGFLKALGCAMKEIDDIVAKVTADKKARRLWITGHSLGAALATLYAARIESVKATAQFTNLMVTGVYTFGSPRVGNVSFIKELSDMIAAKTYRFINHEDLVTRVAPRAMGYDHVGTIMYLEANGTLEKGNAAGWIRFLNTVVDAMNDLKATAGASVKDHSMELYVRKAENLVV